MFKLTEDEILRFLSHSRAFPYLPFSKHVPQAGCSTAHTQHFANSNFPCSSSSASSSVKILALLCSTEKQPTSQPSSPTSIPSSVQNSFGNAKETAAHTHQTEDNESSPSHKRRRLSDDTEKRVNPIKSEGLDSPEGEEVPVKGSSNHTAGGNSNDEKGSREGKQSSPRRRIYLRVQYNKALIETLPLEIMRERHPQILIDYLLSCTMWS